MVTQLDLFYSFTIIVGDAKGYCPKFVDVLIKNKVTVMACSCVLLILLACCGLLILLVWLGSSSLIVPQTSKITAILCVAISKLYNRKLTFLLQPKRSQDFICT